MAERSEALDPIEGNSAVSPAEAWCPSVVFPWPLDPCLENARRDQASTLGDFQEFTVVSQVPGTEEDQACDQGTAGAHQRLAEHPV